MSEHWSLNSTQFANLDVGSLYGSQGLGFYRLHFQVKVNIHKTPDEEQITLTNLNGELFVVGKNGAKHFLGCLRRQGVNSPITTSKYGSNQTINFETELDAARIEAIEKIRLGGDLHFYFSFHGVGSSVQWGTQQLNQVELCYPANQSTWIKILEQIGYRKTLLLEVPLLPEEISPTFANAIKHLQNAQTQLLQGQYRNTVSECRDVLEAISVALDDEKEQTPVELKAWFSDTRSMSKEHRIRLMRRAFKVLTHASKHADNNAASIEWGPTDARMALSMAASLLQMSSGKD
jgi:hypothetical protein